MLLLKTLSKAKADGNEILGVIHAVGGGADADRPQAALQAASKRVGHNAIGSDVRRFVGGANMPHQDVTERSHLVDAFASAQRCDDQTDLINKVGNLLAARGLTTIIQETLKPTAADLTVVSDLGTDWQNYQIVMQSGSKVDAPEDIAESLMEKVGATAAEVPVAMSAVSSPAAIPTTEPEANAV